MDFVYSYKNTKYTKRMKKKRFLKIKKKDKTPG